MMNYSSVNFTTPETLTNSTAESANLTVILVTCMLSINILFVFTTNFFIICLIVKGRKSRLSSEFFNLNLSVCEIGITLYHLMFVCPMGFSNQLPSYFFLGLLFTGRPLFQCLMCVERYLAVVHPVTFLKYKPLRYRLICCAVAWIITLGSCLCSMFILGEESIQVFTLYFSLQFLVFLSIQLFCLVVVLRALKQSGPGERRREEDNHMKRRAFRIILINSASMVLTYVPYIVTGLVTIVTEQVILALWLTSLVCYVIASFVYPVIYLHRTVKVSCCSS